MITIRPIERAEDGRISEADYAIVSKWWRIRAKESPPRTILPTLGVIAEHGDGDVVKPVAAAFAYLDATGSGVAWLGWMITDPNAPKNRAGRGLLRALDFLDKECLALDYWLSWATISDPDFIRFMQRRGYTPTDRGLCHLFKPLR
jgi:hypothetical protein